MDSLWSVREKDLTRGSVTVLHLFSPSTMSSLDQVFTLISALSLLGVAGIGVIATAGANALLPKNARWQDKFAFIWLVSGEHIIQGTLHELPLSRPLMQ